MRNEPEHAADDDCPDNPNNYDVPDYHCSGLDIDDNDAIVHFDNDAIVHVNNVLRAVDHVVADYVLVRRVDYDNLATAIYDTPLDDDYLVNLDRAARNLVDHHDDTARDPGHR
jgi:hypothetical protein